MNTLSLLTFLCIYLYVVHIHVCTNVFIWGSTYVCADECAHMYTRVEAKGCCCLPQLRSILYIEAGPLIGSGASIASLLAPAVLCVCLCHCGMTGMLPCPSGIKWMLGILIQVVMLMWPSSQLLSYSFQWFHSCSLVFFILHPKSFYLLPRKNY